MGAFTQGQVLRHLLAAKRFLLAILRLHNGNSWLGCRAEGADRVIDTVLEKRVRTLSGQTQLIYARSDPIYDTINSFPVNAIATCASCSRAWNLFHPPIGNWNCVGE